MGLTNCKLVMTEYLYSRNPFYELRLPISLIGGILFFQYFEKKSKNVLLKVILPILVVLIIHTILQYSGSLFVDQAELNHLINTCEAWKRKNEPIINPYSVAQMANNGSSPSSSQNSEHFFDIPSSLTLDLSPDNDSSLSLPNLTPDNPSDSDEYTLDSNDIDQYQHPHILPSQPAARQSNCLLGTDPCSPLCSGDGQNPCNIVAPIPSSAWQVRTAEAVQNSLAQGNFTASSCLAN
jgi:hypothetical protein